MAKKVFIVCGEPSGDLIASKLVREILRKDDAVLIEALCGAKTESLGVKSIFPMSDISVMGITEILPKLPRIIFRFFQIYRKIIKFDPDVLVTIDSPGFNFPLVKMLRARKANKIKFVNYVAPSVWAYKPERVNLVKKLFDHQIVILPFEKKYFDDVSMPCTYIGHPIFEGYSNKSYDKAKSPILAIMPGSRVNEIKMHSKIFSKSYLLLKKQIPSLKCVVFTLPHLKELAIKSFSDIDCDIIDSHEMKESILPKCLAAIVKSGTASLEVLKFNVPMVIAYKVSFITAWYVKRKLNIPHISIANIIAGKELIPELLQEKCTAEIISNKLLPLLNDSLDRKSALFEYREISNQLYHTGISSELAADVIIKYIKDE
jgi:lipid-A-disaccharide synthase